MASEVWPLTLPQYFSVEGFGQKAKPNTIRSKIDAGIDKVRRRYTIPIVNMGGTMQLTHAQYIILEDFYNVILKSGVERFNYTDPANPTKTYEYRFTDEPDYGALQGVYYNVSLKWERLQDIT